MKVLSWHDEAARSLLI